MAKYAWNGAVITVLLNKLTDSPVGTKWDNKFMLPTDYIRALSINEMPSPGGERDLWEIQVSTDHTDRFLLTDQTAVTLRYIADVENVGVLGPRVVEAMGVDFAARLAKIFSLNAALVTDLTRRARLLSESAMSVDGKEGSSQTFSDRSLIRVRRVGGDGFDPVGRIW